MKLLKKGVMIVLAMAQIFTTTSFVKASSEATITNLRANDVIAPMGIDAPPSFSWEMQSSINGQKQTAYEIIVSKAQDLSNPVWSSGKVQSGISNAIKYSGEELSSFTKYYWCVSVWDKNDVKITSDTTYFEMGMTKSSNWDGSYWIKNDESDDEDRTVNYILEADIKIINTGVALLFEAKDKSNFLMWQLRNTDNKLVLRPHYRKNGNFSVIGESVVTSAMNESLTSNQHLKIAVTDERITTYLNNTQVSVINTSDLGGTELSYDAGRLGFRSDYIEQEDGYIDNIKITDYSSNTDGVVIKAYDFNDGVNPFSAGAVDNGSVRTTYASGVELVSLEPDNETTTTPAKYSVEADLTCTDSAVSVLFSAKDDKNFYMWQLNTKEQNGKVLLRPHTCTDGTFSIYSGHFRDITSNVGGVDSFATTPVHVKIDVTETTIKTYIADTLVDTFAVGTVSDTNVVAAAPIIGDIGTRTSETEAGTIDNLKLTDYLTNQDGDIVYNYTFDDTNPLVVGTIADGKYIAEGNYGVMLPKKGVDTFRKEFATLDKQIKSARVYMSGLGVFDAFINGKRIGVINDDGSVTYDELKPGHSQPAKQVFYFTYDVTTMLRSNESNVISANVSSGWWGGRISGHYGDNSAFRAKLIITYSDETTTVIGTDKTWKTAKYGPIITADIYDGETYDANADLSYREVGFDDSGWINAKRDKQFRGEISSIYGSNIRVRKDLERTYKTATLYDGVTGASLSRHGVIDIKNVYENGEAFTLKSGETAVIDLGQNFAGWEHIWVEGEKNTVLTIRHGEILNDKNGSKARGNDGPEGSIYTANLRSAKATTRYIMNGNGVEEYCPSHTFYGFRYLEIKTTKDVTIHNIKGDVVTSVLEDVGTLTTSNELINKLISNIKWGHYSNYVSIPTDCPQRDERQGWTADTQVFSTAAAYNANSKEFLRKYMEDMRNSQREDGAFPDTAPYTGYGTGGQLGWADAGIIIPYNLYKMYGDKEIISENYDAMKKYMDVFLASTNKRGAGHDFGDWLAYESNDETIKSMLGVAFYAWDAKLMVEMATAIGNTADAEKYKKVYNTEKNYFISQFVNADGTLKRKEQTACLYALMVDLLPNEKSKELAKKALLDNIARNSNKLQTGFLGTAIIMQTLSDAGASDVAYKLLTQEANPSWLYSVNQGATTIWERWNSYTKESGFGDVAMNSFNHYAYGAVAEWMYGYMAGISYDTKNPGFKNIILQPTPDKTFTDIKCDFKSPYGLISSNWKYEGNILNYDAKIPANTTATIYLPIQPNADITVNGVSYKTVSKDKCGIEYMKTENGKAVFEAVSGSYSFTTDHTVVDKEPESKPVVTPTKKVAVSKVSLSAKKTKINIGKTVALKVAASPSNATNKGVTFSSSNKKLATVSKTGVVTGLKAGVVTITAKSVDNGKITGKIKITVKPKKVSGIKTSVKKRKVTVSFTPVKNVKKYTVELYKGSKRIKKVTATKTAKKLINKKLKSGIYKVKIKYTYNKATSDYATKQFKVK